MFDFERFEILQSSVGDILTKKRNQLSDNSGMLVGLHNVPLVLSLF